MNTKKKIFIITVFLVSLLTLTTTYALNTDTKTKNSALPPSALAYEDDDDDNDYDEIDIETRLGSKKLTIYVELDEHQKNKNINIYVNGKKYTTKSNSYGVGKITITASPSTTYKITAQAKVYNTRTNKYITIKDYERIKTPTKKLIKTTTKTKYIKTKDTNTYRYKVYAKYTTKTYTNGKKVTTKKYIYKKIYRIKIITIPKTNYKTSINYDDDCRITITKSGSKLIIKNNDYERDELYFYKIYKGSKTSTIKNYGGTKVFNSKGVTKIKIYLDT